MTRVGHLFDESAGWEQRVAAAQLLDRLPSPRYAGYLAAIHSRPVALLRSLNRRVDLLPRLPGLTAAAAPAVAKLTETRRVDLIHAWGLPAALAAGMGGRVPLVIGLFDPSLTTRAIKLLRSLPRPNHTAVACGCETVRRRLLEGGLSPNVCPLIRPGVDFGSIGQTHRQALRAELNLSPDNFVVITPEPAVREGGQFEAFLGTKLFSYSSPNARVIVPGPSREQRRISRFARALPGRSVLLSSIPPYGFERLVSVADVLVVAPRREGSTTAIAWAMAAGVPVIGAAVPAVARLIADGLTGLLFRRAPGESPAVPIARLLGDRVAQAEVREFARRHAYETFGLSRYIKQHARLYDNLLNGTPPAEGISDPVSAI